VSRAGSATAASAATADARRGDVEGWTVRLGTRHSAYRAAVAPLDDLVAIVCVSGRPQCLASLLDSVTRQDHGAVELILVTNSIEYEDVDVEGIVEERVSGLVAATVVRRHATESLGSCLNAGMGATEARFVAKFDDDDLYGSAYLTDAMRAHAYAGAAVVGKHTYYAYLASGDRTVLRFPAHEFSYSSTLAGGTLVLDRDRVGAVRFPDISIGEDRAFIAACHRSGQSTFSADRFNFVQVRSGDNTWRIGDHEFLAGTVPVDVGLPLDVINI
jgi:hypothetical protein